jgi:hypothetical protein
MNENDMNTEGSRGDDNPKPTDEREPIVATRGFDANRKPKEVVWGDGRRPNPDRVCTARKTNGQPCTRIAIHGGNVCPAHGGLAPRIQAKARARLQSAADRMAKELLKIAVSDDAPETVKLAAIKDALDRAGLGAKTAVEVSLDPKPFEEVLGTIMTGGSRAESRSQRGDVNTPPPEHDWITEELGVIDAEVVDEPPTPPIPTPRPTPSSPAPTVPTQATGSGLMDYSDALDILRSTAPPPQAAAPRRNRRS